MLGAVLGLTLAPGINAQGMGAGGWGGGWPLAIGDTRYLLTRPIRVTPTPAASACHRNVSPRLHSCTVHPAAARLAAPGTRSVARIPRRAVEACSLNLLAVGPHPSLFGLLAASHFLRFYIGLLRRPL